MDDSYYAARILSRHTCAHSRPVFFSSVPPKPSKHCGHVGFARVTARSTVSITRSEFAKADDGLRQRVSAFRRRRLSARLERLGHDFLWLVQSPLRFLRGIQTSQFGEGAEVNAPELAGIMLDLQEIGCHNINFVTPEHVVPQILEALVIAIDRGDSDLPRVPHTSAYDSLDESIRWMDGVVDIDIPDFKLWDAEHCRKYLVAGNYAEAARAVIAAMHAQVGELKVDVNGLALRGRGPALAMPGLLEDTREIMRWIAEIFRRYLRQRDDQYYPAHKAETEPRFAEINRRTSDHEFCSALELARDARFPRLDTRWRNVIPHGAPVWLPRARQREASAR